MKFRSIISLLAASVVLTSCSSIPHTSSSPQGEEGYPVDVTSCGKTLHFDRRPQKVIMMSLVDATIMDRLGLLDQIDYRVGDNRLPSDYADLAKRIDAIPTLDASTNDTGGVVLSNESILNAEADLIIGYSPSVSDQSALEEAGVQIYTTEAYCPDFSADHADWSFVDQEVDKIAAIFGVRERGEKLKEEIHRTIDSISVPDRHTSAAALYVTPGSSTFYAYGSSSMVQPIFETNGLTNAYADNSTRVFDASMEDLLKRDPKWIVILSDPSSAQEALESFSSMPGADGLQAVRNHRMIHLDFPYTDPPSDLSVEGARQLSTAMEKA